MQAMVKHPCAYNQLPWLPQNASAEGRSWAHMKPQQHAGHVEKYPPTANKRELTYKAASTRIVGPLGEGITSGLRGFCATEFTIFSRQRQCDMKEEQEGVDQKRMEKKF